MTDRLRGKRVLLTGGVANIGLEILQAFLAEGATVTLVDIDATRGEALERELAPRVRFIRTDLTDASQIAAAVDAAQDWMGGLIPLS